MTSLHSILSPVLSQLFSDPTSALELIAMLFAALYLCRAALSPIVHSDLHSGIDSGDGLREQAVRPLSLTTSISRANSIAGSFSKSFTQSFRLLTLFEVGGCIPLPKRSLMSQHITR